jgi:deuterolysin
MKFLNILPLISLVAAASNDTTPAVPVEVKIEQVGATAFKATVQSHHTADLKLLKTGSILDDSAVEKATVLSGGKSKLIYKIHRGTQ